MTLARAKDILSWCLSVLPEDPPQQGPSGWTHAMREEWDARRQEIVDLLDAIEDSAAHGEPPDGRSEVPTTRKESLVGAGLQPRTDQPPAVVLAAPAGSPGRAAQIERVGLPLDPERPSRLCSVCLSPDHPAPSCEWDYAR